MEGVAEAFHLLVGYLVSFVCLSESEIMTSQLRKFLVLHEFSALSSFSLCFLTQQNPDYSVSIMLTPESSKGNNSTTKGNGSASFSFDVGICGYHFFVEGVSFARTHNSQSDFNDSIL